MLVYEQISLTISIIVFSSIIGAYLGTMEYRIRQNLPLITKDCFCPICNHKLSLLQQIPVISWIFLKGHCKYCNQKISIRYPLFESGCILFYLFIYIIFQKQPILMVLLWYLFICILLLFRCKFFSRNLINGLFIMLFYHFIFGSLIIILLSTL